ncbi:Glutathione transport system permease protein gsiC [Serratia plymuthica]|uniref:Glutathione transport system permease protein gsiC n=1 Tax=Serratia plymuthica TaxID=82996 RepID=A0A2X4UA00_SERPL|nr:Glutathione transport system permease protein gsiC [Serratia plymuthica]
MLNYFLKRLLGLIPTLLIVAVLVFLFVHLLPGDPARLAAGPDADEAVVQLVRKDLGLDKPLPQQFVHFFVNALQGDFGTSMVSKRPVSEEIGSRFLPTLWLTLTSMLWAVIFGMAIGMVSAVWRNRWPDRLGMTLAVSGIFIPRLCAGHAADAGIFRQPRLVADGGGRQLAALYSALDYVGRGGGGGDGALYPRFIR